MAVDADPNACLGLSLGLESGNTIADLREDILKQKPAPQQGMGRLEAFEFGCEQLLTEAKGFDLVTMGRPEGPGCYCAINNVLRKFLDQLAQSYEFVVIDNEAGMEHISRRTTNNVDLLVVVADTSKVGVSTARRIVELTSSLPVTIGRVGIVWNRTDRAADDDVHGTAVLGTVPHDEDVANCSMKGETVFDLNGDCAALSAVRQILQQEFSNEQDYLAVWRHQNVNTEDY